MKRNPMSTGAKVALGVAGLAAAAGVLYATTREAEAAPKKKPTSKLPPTPTPTPTPTEPPKPAERILVDDELYGWPYQIYEIQDESGQTYKRARVSSPDDTHKTSFVVADGIDTVGAIKEFIAQNMWTPLDQMPPAVKILVGEDVEFGTPMPPVFAVSTTSTPELVLQGVGTFQEGGRYVFVAYGGQPGQAFVTLIVHNSPTDDGTPLYQARIQVAPALGGKPP